MENKPMTPEEIQQHKAAIDKMSREEMARLWRFAAAGHPYFVRGEVSDHFEKRFKELGGFSPEISKEIGWERPK
jgi:hypothetical protein